MPCLQGVRIFVGESEAYKASIAAHREAEELAALQKEQQRLLASSTPATASALQKPMPRGGQPLSQQPQGFAAWPAQGQAQNSIPSPAHQPAVPVTETQRSSEAIYKIAQQVDEIEQKVRLWLQSACLL